MYLSLFSALPYEEVEESYVKINHSFPDAFRGEDELQPCLACPLPRFGRVNTAHLTPITPSPSRPWTLPPDLLKASGSRERGASPTLRPDHEGYEQNTKVRVNSSGSGVETGDIIHGLTRKLTLHIIDPTNATLPCPPEKNPGNRKKDRATQSSSVSPSAAAFFFFTFFSRRGFTSSSLSS